MKNYKNQLLIPFFLGCCFFISCKKGAAEDKIILANQPAAPDHETGIYIPAKLTTGKSETIFSYNAANVLAKIKYENGDSTVVKFNAAGKPTRLNRYKNGIYVHISYYTLTQDGMISEVEQYTVDSTGSRKVVGYLKLNYNSDKKINIVSYYTAAQLIYTQQYSYSPTGNLLAQTSTEATLNATYAYDTKNALFKNVENAWLFALEKENNLFLSVLNNIQTCSYPSNTAANSTNLYVYNAANFPKIITSTIKGVNTTTSVTYK